MVQVITRKEEARLRERAKAMDSLFYLCTEVLGYKDMEKEFHGRVCRWFQTWPTKPSGKPYRYRLTQLPRGHFKSTVGTVAQPIYRWLWDPMLAFLNTHFKATGSMVNLREIKVQLAENDKLRDIAPDIFYRDPDKESSLWVQDKINIARPHLSRDPSFYCTGIDATVVGLHFDHFIIDDIVVEENVGTEDQIRKSIMYFQTLPGLYKDPNTVKVDVIGTHWAPNDAYAFLKQPGNGYYDPDPEKSQIAILNEGCFGVDPETGRSYSGSEPEHQPLFPSRYSREALLDMKAAMGSYAFSCQYLNDPIADDVVTFDPSQIQFFSQDQMDAWKAEGKSFLYYTAVDPNRKQEMQHDPGVVMTVARDVEGNFFVVDVTYSRFSPTSIVEEILRQATKWNSEETWIEDTAGQILLMEPIHQAMRQRHIYARITPVTRGPKDHKVQRILRCHPVIERGKLWLPTEMGTDHPLYREIQNYGTAGKTHDHALDALSDIVHRSRTPDRPRVAAEPRGQFELSRILEGRNARTSKRGFHVHGQRW